MRKSVIACTLISFLTSACAPAFRKGPLQIQQIEMPKSLVEANHAIEPQASYQSRHDWWVIFNDHNLDELLEVGLETNPSLAEAKARINVAQAEILSAGASEYPHVDSTNKITHLHQSSNGDHAIYNGKTYTTAEINPLVLTYHLDVFGEDQEIISSVKANAEIVRSQYKQSLLMLRAAIIKTYFALEIAEQLVKTQNEIVSLSQASETVKQTAYRAGIQSSANTITQKIYISNAKSKLADLHQKNQALRYALSNLLGKGPNYQPLIKAGESTIPDKFQIPQSMSLNTISQRPDIQMALWNIKYAYHIEKSAQKAYYPNLSLRSLIGLNSIGLSNIFKAGSQTFALGPALSLPIFEGGALKGKFEASASAYDVSVYSYNKTVLNAAQQVATELANLDNSKESLEDKSNYLLQTTALAKVYAAEYRSGVSDKLVDIEAKIQLKNAYLNYLESKLNWLYAITDMATALGGEFQGEINEN